MLLECIFKPYFIVYLWLTCLFELNSVHSLLINKPEITNPSSLECIQDQFVSIKNIRFDINDINDDRFIKYADEKIIVTIQCSNCSVRLSHEYERSHEMGVLYYKKGDIFGGNFLEVEGNLKTTQLALSSVTYTPNKGYYGEDAILITINRRWNKNYEFQYRIPAEYESISSSDKILVSIREHIPIPDLNILPYFYSEIGVPLKLSPKIITNKSFVKNVRLKISCEIGQIYFLNHKCESSKSCVLDLNPSIDSINDQLSELYYNGTEMKQENINFIVSDSFNNTVSYTTVVSVISSVSAPYFKLPSASDAFQFPHFISEEDQQLLFSDLEIVSNNENLEYSLTMRCAHCRLSFYENRYLRLVNRNVSSFVVSSSIVWLNRLLRSVIYLPVDNWSGIDNITCVLSPMYPLKNSVPTSSSSSVPSEVVTASFAVIVTPAPEIPIISSSMQTFWGYENSTFKLSNITFVDPDDTSNSSFLLLTLTAVGGQILIPDSFVSLLSITFDEEDNYILVGDIVTFNELFRNNIEFSPQQHFNIVSHGFGKVDITVEKFDPVNKIRLSSKVRKVFNVCLQPVIYPVTLKVPANINGFEDKDMPLSGVLLTTMNDGHGISSLYTLSLSVSIGELKLNFTSKNDIFSISSTSKNKLVFKCKSVQSCNSILSSILYIPLENWNGEDVLELGLVEDRRNRRSEETVVLLVSPVNDAPVVYVPKDTWKSKEDEQINIQGIFVDDVDFVTNYIASSLLRLKIVCDIGVISLFGFEVYSVSDSTLELSDFEKEKQIAGKPHGINTALVNFTS